MCLANYNRSVFFYQTMLFLSLIHSYTLGVEYLAYPPKVTSDLDATNKKIFKLQNFG